MRNYLEEFGVLYNSYRKLNKIEPTKIYLGENTLKYFKDLHSSEGFKGIDFLKQCLSLEIEEIDLPDYIWIS